MKDRFILKIIAFLLLVAIIGLFLELTGFEEPTASILFDLGLRVGEVLGLVLLLRHGALMKTVYWGIIKFLIGVFLLGLLFKILHLPGADPVLSFPFIGVVIVYTVRFFKKATTSPLDFFKYFWVLTTFLGTFFIFFDLIPAQWQYLGIGVFWLTFSSFWITELRPKLTQKTDPH
jgi:hypothetical protein